jgi:hypothetical protein
MTRFLFTHRTPTTRERRSLRELVARAGDRLRSPLIDIAAVSFQVNSGAANASVSQRLLNDG